MHIRLEGPGFSSSGHGDFFSRARYIRTLGRWSIGASFEVIAPWGSEAFSSGRWQTNPAARAVYAWRPQNLSALAAC
jgi:hypothetical protein